MLRISKMKQGEGQGVLGMGRGRDAAIQIE